MAWLKLAVGALVGWFMGGKLIDHWGGQADTWSNSNLQRIVDNTTDDLRLN